MPRRERDNSRTQGPDAASCEEAILPEKIGHYLILRKLGQGGMGIVYLARDPRLQRTIALKKLSSATLDKRERLEREARAIAQLQHEHVVRLLSSECDSDGTPFLTMEYVDGVHLGELMHHPLDVDVKQRVRYVNQVASGLEVAHQAGILHRDIKPSNILITSSGIAKLADFSLAQFIESTESPVTQVGVIVGTPAYMSPEQARGDELDARGDIYSLGCVLYELLAGVPPYQGTQIQILRQVMESDPRPIRQLNERVPIELEIICQTAMATSRENRYATASDFAADLRRFQVGEPIHARAASWGSRTSKWVRRNPWQTAAASLALLGLVGALASAVLIRSANVRLQVSHDNLRVSHERLTAAEQDTQKSFTLTRELLKRIVDRMQNDLIEVPQAEKLAVESMRDSAELHRRLLELRPKDAELALDYIESLKGLWLTEWLYHHHEQEAQALKEYQQQAEILSSAFPEKIEIRALYADLLTDLSIEEEQKGNRDGADAWAQKAKAQFVPLQKQAPDAACVCKLAWKMAFQDYRQCQERSASIEDQLTAASYLVECCERCVKTAPAEALDGESQMLCDNLCRLAEIQTTANRLADAEANLERVQGICDNFQTSRESRFWRMVTIRLQSCRAGLEIARGGLPVAREALARAVAECRSLQSEYPVDPGVRKRLAQVLYGVARMEWEHGDKVRAHQPMEESIQILTALANEGLSRESANEMLENLHKLRQEMAK